MAQFARPASDAENNWANGGFADIDESVASDSDFANSQDNPDPLTGNSGYFRVNLSTLTDPASSADHVIRWRHALIDGGVLAGASGTGCDLDVQLVQGASTVIASKLNIVLDSVFAWTDDSLTLSTGEADSITDYTDLDLVFDADGGGGSPANRRGAGISWAEFEVPDASGATPQALVATATATPTLTFLIKKVFVVAATGTPILATKASFKRTLTATATATPILLKKRFITFAVGATGTAILATKLVFKQVLAAAATGTAVMTNKSTFKQILTTTATATPAFVKKIFKILTATATGAATLVTNATVAGGITYIGEFWRRWHDRRQRKTFNHRTGGKR